jgi:hypothetical protein
MANASLPQEQAARAAVSGELEEEGRGLLELPATPTALERLTRAAYERGQRDALLNVLPMYADLLRRVTAVEVDSAGLAAVSEAVRANVDDFRRSVEGMAPREADQDLGPFDRGHVHNPEMAGRE